MLPFQFVCLETLITAISDELAAVWPQTRRWKWLIILGTCCSMFVIGLPLVTQVRKAWHVQVIFATTDSSPYQPIHL